MNLKIKVSPQEFEAACSNGCVYGEVRRKAILYAYVDLGQEKPYLDRPGDNSETRFRAFANCNVFFAETEADVNNSRFQGELSNQYVIIYC